MTYWKFHLFLILPAIAVLLYLLRRKPAPLFRGTGWGFLLIAMAAAVYTAPWDNYLIWRGVWSYAPDHVTLWLRLGYVPLEEYCFFFLQPVLTGLFLLYFAQHHRRKMLAWLCRSPRRWPPRLSGGLLALFAAGAGMAALFLSPHGTYFGLILIWAAPVIALHWFYGGDYLWQIRSVLASSLIISTFYLSVIDRVAIEWKIWSIAPATSTGWNLLGLPLEEAAFFVITNLLVIQGLLLYFKFSGSARTPVPT